MHEEGKGKANSISGIPLSGGFTQIDEGSAEPNREEETNTFKEERRYEPYAHDYFRDETERLEKLSGSLPATPNEEWSEGLNDEANQYDNNLPMDQGEEIQSDLLEDFGSAVDLNKIADTDINFSAEGVNSTDLQEPENGDRA